MKKTSAGEILATNLAKLMAEYSDLNTQVKVAKKSGVGQTTIGRILRNEVSVTAENLEAIAYAFGLSAGELLSQKEQTTSNVAPALVGTRRVPIINYVQAKKWTEMADTYAAEDIEGFLLTDLEIGSDAFALRIEGESMLPDFCAGDVVLIDPVIEPCPGDFVVAKNGPGAAIFKKYRPRSINEHGQPVFELVPLNEDYPSMRSDIVPIEIVGTMVEHRRYRRKRI